MQGFTVAGDNGYTNCQIESGTSPLGALTGRIQLAAATPAVYAQICDPATGAAPDAASVSMVVTAPDGTTYSTVTNTATVFVQTAGGNPCAIVVLNPAAGEWKMAVACTAAVSYRANLQTVPLANPTAAALSALAPKYPGDPAQPSDTVEYQMFRWAFQPAAVVLHAASGTSSLAMDLVAVIQSMFGVAQTVAQQMVTQMAGLPVNGVAILLAQQATTIGPLVNEPVLQNGSADRQLSGWTVIAGNWTVESGYARWVGVPNDFAVSNTPTKKSQTIDLVQGAGFTAQYLDTAPAISVIDWVTAPRPQGATGTSQYYLIVRLLDANLAVLKEFQTGMIDMPASPLDNGVLVWTACQCAFVNYGAGVRHIYIEDGGQNPQAWTGSAGLKITGTAVGVQLAPAVPALRELLTNGSAQQGLSGWSETPANSWTAETGPALTCPAMAGTTDFGVASGTAAKSQSIDLVQAGYAADYLDLSPQVSISQWVANSAACACAYTLKVELRDQNQQPIATYNPGPLTVAQFNGGFIGFQSMAAVMSGYPTGLRFIYFEHSAAPASVISGQTPAKITAASVQMAPPPPTQLIERAIADVAPSPPVKIIVTDTYPYYWVAECLSYFNNNAVRTIGSSWLLPMSGGNFILMTAAHNGYRGDLGWANKLEIKPAQGGSNPYNMASVALGQFYMPIEYFTRNQAKPTYFDSYDYAVLVIPAGLNWRSDGFAIATESDTEIDNQAASVTGYPSILEQFHVMFRQDVVLPGSNPTQIEVPTEFREGASGGPLYIRNTNTAIGVYGTGIPGWFSITNYATRINDAVAKNIGKWSRPIAATDRVCKLQLAIGTSGQAWSRTSAPITFSFDNHIYNLDDLWIPESGTRSQAKQTGHIDGYDLTAAIRANYPHGLQVQDLIGKNYQLGLVAQPSWWLPPEWLPAFLVIYVNGQKLCLSTFTQRVNAASPAQGTFTLG